MHVKLVSNISETLCLNSQQLMWCVTELGGQLAEPDSQSPWSTLLSLDIPTSWISSRLPALTEACWTPGSIKDLEQKQHPWWSHQNLVAPVRPPSLVHAACNSKQYHEVLEVYLVLCLNSILSWYKLQSALVTSHQHTNSLTLTQLIAHEHFTANNHRESFKL
jgi:hypothetical protein